MKNEQQPSYFEYADKENSEVFPKIKEGYTILPFPSLETERAMPLDLDEAQVRLQAFFDYIEENGAEIVNLVQIPVQVKDVYSRTANKRTIPKHFAIVKR